MADKLKIGPRLKAARKVAGFKTSQAFCEKFNIPTSTYSQNESGLKAPRPALLKKYAEYLEVNLQWLRTGIGTPILDDTSNKTAKLKEELAEEQIADEIIQQRYASVAIDEQLLAELLNELMEQLHQKTGHIDMNIIAKAAAGLYDNLRKNENDPKLRAQMIKVAVDTYMKFFFLNRN